VPDALTALLDQAGPALSPDAPDVLPDGPTALRGELAALLARRNGFLALDGAVHVLPASGDGMTVQAWNAPDLWRGEYDGLADDLLFYAMDAFGNPFALHESGVVLFDAETGSRERVAATLDGWAHALLTDGYWSGWPLAQAWQAQHGPIPFGSRLMPTQLFVLGGAFDPSNLKAVPTLETLLFRGYVARTIKDLPDGAQIELRVVD